MSLPKSEPLYTPEQYLTLERRSDERHEYLDGRLFAMAGESLIHGDICMNLGRIISTQLLGTKCRVLLKDIKVRSGPSPLSRKKLKGFFLYPDLVVICGEPQVHDEHRDVFLNPTLIIEVLSPSTEAFDRGEKWLRYQMWLPSLTDYLLVSQSMPQVEHYQRQQDGGWRYSLINDPKGIISLPSIGCTLNLSDIYDRVVFPAEPSEMAEE